MNVIISPIYGLLINKSDKLQEQAGAELGQAQLKLEPELSFTWFKIFNKNTTGYFDCH